MVEKVKAVELISDNKITRGNVKARGKYCFGILLSKKPLVRFLNHFTEMKTFYLTPSTHVASKNI